MRVGILGTGDVGRALGGAFVTLGHEVRMGAREATNAKASAWAKEAGRRASAGTFADAASFGEVVVFATLGVVNEHVAKAAGADAFAGKVVIDATNPLDFSAGMPPTLAVSGNDSGGEQLQRLLPDAHVVKAFNTIGNALMFRPVHLRRERRREASGGGPAR
jgi:predicted dinucleotide-binding enzyme